ncbi:MAG: hypothetical protein ACRCZB_08315 [Bacteroidales bacterium]
MANAVLERALQVAMEYIDETDITDGMFEDRPFEDVCKIMLVLRKEFMKNNELGVGLTGEDEFFKGWVSIVSALLSKKN